MNKSLVDLLSFDLCSVTAFDTFDVVGLLLLFHVTKQTGRRRGRGPKMLN
jgi:hypothetical protein